MTNIPMYQVDAFTDRLFSGNPAAVCILKDWLPDEIMQAIGAENNLAETVFVVARERHFEIRWFTPTIEVDLCGHATLAAAYVLFHCRAYGEAEIVFDSPRSGRLMVSRQGDLLFLDFPMDVLHPCEEAVRMGDCTGILPLEVYRGKTDYLAVFASEQVVRDLKPDLAKIAQLQARGLIVTAKGNEVDFVSRFFAPQSGIDEDPVTGSAHTSLIPFWSEKLGKKEMIAQQVSKRGGTLICIHEGSRSRIGGTAKLYLTGEIHL